MADLPIIKKTDFAMDVDAQGLSSFKVGGGKDLGVQSGDKVEIESDGEQLTIKPTFEWGTYDQIAIDKNGHLSTSTLGGVWNKNLPQGRLRQNAVGILQNAQRQASGTMAQNLANVLRSLETPNMPTIAKMTLSMDIDADGLDSFKLGDGKDLGMRSGNEVEIECDGVRLTIKPTWEWGTWDRFTIDKNGHIDTSTLGGLWNKNLPQDRLQRNALNILKQAQQQTSGDLAKTLAEIVGRLESEGERVSTQPSTSG